MQTEEQALPMEETMLYREPTDDSDENQVHDIWGRQLETRVVPSAEVAAFLAEGWVAHPLDLGGDSKKPEEVAGFVQDKGKGGKELTDTRLALDTAQRLCDEQAAEIKRLEKVAQDTGADLLKAQSDLKAAEELADAETKAKEEAVAAHTRVTDQLTAAQAKIVELGGTEPGAKPEESKKKG